MQAQPQHPPAPGDPRPPSVSLHLAIKCTQLGWLQHKPSQPPLGTSAAGVTRTGSVPEPAFLPGGRASLLMSICQHPPINKSICIHLAFPCHCAFPCLPTPSQHLPQPSPTPVFPNQASSQATLPASTGAAHPQTPCSSHHAKADPNFKAFLYQELIQETFFLDFYCTATCL